MRFKNFLTTFFTFILAGIGLLEAQTISSRDPERLVASEKVIHQSSQYWTAERMAKAKPVPLRERRFMKRTVKPTMHQGTPGFGNSGLPGKIFTDLAEQILPIASPSSSPQRQDYTYPPPFARYQNFDSYDTYPYSAVVKIFFSDGGDDFVCSGAVWPSRSIITAGHCVYNDQAHRYHTNVIVVPQYINGQSPYGGFEASNLFTTQGWQDGDFSYDLGLIVTRDKNGSKISSYTGFLGGRWNVTAIQHWTVIGYPAERPFNGEFQQICQTSFAYKDTGSAPQPNGAGCDLTGGSSGGPWIVRFSGKGGNQNQVNGVTSYGYAGRPKELYAPYFGDAAKNFWNYAKSH
jgi:V8-like Glu-specific endopeptidase